MEGFASPNDKKRGGTSWTLLRLGVLGFATLRPPQGWSGLARKRRDRDPGPLPGCTPAPLGLPLYPGWGGRLLASAPAVWVRGGGSAVLLDWGDGLSFHGLANFPVGSAVPGGIFDGSPVGSLERFRSGPGGFLPPHLPGSWPGSGGGGWRLLGVWASCLQGVRRARRCPARRQPRTSGLRVTFGLGLPGRAGGG